MHYCQEHRPVPGTWKARGSVRLLLLLLLPSLLLTPSGEDTAG